MKKLISAGDVELAKEQGKKVIYIDSNTIVTSLAEDIAEVYEIKIAIRSDISDKESSNNDIDMEMVYKVFTKLMDKELLSKVMELVGGKPYEFEYDPSGLKLIRGNTVQFKKIEEENPNIQVLHRQLTKSKDGTINSGLLSIDSSEYTWNTETEEVYYIIDGNVKVEIDNSIFTGYPGDILYIPTGSKVTISSLDKGKLFYTTYLDK